MENDFNCKIDVTDYGLYGLPCNTTLTGININNKYYIKCKDQPWETDDLRNEMTESYVYDLFLSESPLIIEDYKPNDKEELTAATEPFSVDLKLQTSGGAEDGKAECRWEGNGFSDYFTKTNSNIHTYGITTATSGLYNMKYICEDVAGNVAEKETSFTLSIDNNGPVIARVYYDNGLKVITNEQAECRFDFNKNFVFENASIMGGNNLKHTTSWKPKTYYLQCKDKFNNKGNKLIIKAYDLL
jgi:hypothetical protein